MNPCCGNCDSRIMIPLRELREGETRRIRCRKGHDDTWPEAPACKDWSGDDLMPEHVGYGPPEREVELRKGSDD